MLNNRVQPAEVADMCGALAFVVQRDTALDTVNCLQQVCKPSEFTDMVMLAASEMTLTLGTL